MFENVLVSLGNIACNNTEMRHKLLQEPDFLYNIWRLHARSMRGIRNKIKKMYENKNDSNSNSNISGLDMDIDFSNDEYKDIKLIKKLNSILKQLPERCTITSHLNRVLENISWLLYKLATYDNFFNFKFPYEDVYSRNHPRPMLFIVRKLFRIDHNKMRINVTEIVDGIIKSWSRSNNDMYDPNFPWWDLRDLLYPLRDFLSTVDISCDDPTVNIDMAVRILDIFSLECMQDCTTCMDVLPTVSSLFTRIIDEYNKREPRGEIKKKFNDLLNQMVLMIGNYLATVEDSDDDIFYTQEVIDADILPKFIQSIPCRRYGYEMRKNIAWVFSNVTYQIKCEEKYIDWEMEKIIWIGYLKSNCKYNTTNCNNSDMDMDIDEDVSCFMLLSKDLIVHILSFLNSKFDRVYDREQTYLQEQRYEQIQYLIQCDFLPNFCTTLLDCGARGPCRTDMCPSLDCLQNVLKYGEYLKKKHGKIENEYASLIFRLGGVEKVECLSSWFAVFLLFCVVNVLVP